MPPELTPANRKKRNTTRRRMAEAAISAATDAQYEITRHAGGSKNYEKSAEYVTDAVNTRLSRRIARLGSQNSNAASVTVGLAFPGQEGGDLFKRIAKFRTNLANSKASDDDDYGLLFYRSWTSTVGQATKAANPTWPQRRGYAKLVQITAQRVLQVIDVHASNGKEAS
jgi:hypothetical protein